MDYETENGRYDGKSDPLHNTRPATIPRLSAVF